MITFASTNTHKIKEVARIAEHFKIEISAPAELPDIVEDGSTFFENAKKKAVEYAKMLGVNVLAEDSGLIVDSLNGLPGIYSKRFIDLEINTLFEITGISEQQVENRDEENYKRLLSLLGGTKDRGGRYVCSAVLASPAGEIIASAEGTCEFQIMDSPRGSGGFGYDPIVEATAFKGKRVAELSNAEKDSISHRRRALEALFAKLSSEKSFKPA